MSHINIQETPIRTQYEHGDLLTAGPFVIEVLRFDTGRWETFCYLGTRMLRPKVGHDVPERASSRQTALANARRWLRARWA